MNLLEDLKNRGLVKGLTHPEELEVRLSEKPITLYCGFDPTAESLHVGSLLPLVTLLRFQKEGHNIIPLVGGATGMIGDPSGKSEERNLNTTDLIEGYKLGIMNQIQKIVKAECVDNASWVKDINMITFLRDFGKHFSVNAMLGKESVKQRVERPEQGISFTEFSYMLIQAMDFLKLHENKGCELQIGGSDQWGNITAGTDLIRKSLGSVVDAFGLTIPLITNADGKKFGKTEAGAIWLDPKLTSPFQFFQFWLKTGDADIINFLKFFSMKSLEEIAKIERIDAESGKKPEAQMILAKELTELVHGKENLESVMSITDALFSSDFSKLSLAEFEQLKLDGMPSFNMESGTNIVDFVLESELAKSKRAAKEFIKNGAIQVNGKKETSSDFSLSKDNSFFGKFFIIKRGKRNFALIELS